MTQAKNAKDGQTSTGTIVSATGVVLLALQEVLNRTELDDNEYCQALTLSNDVSAASTVYLRVLSDAREFLEGFYPPHGDAIGR